MRAEGQVKVGQPHGSKSRVQSHLSEVQVTAALKRVKRQSRNARGAGWRNSFQQCRYLWRGPPTPRTLERQEKWFLNVRAQPANPPQTSSDTLAVPRCTHSSAHTLAGHPGKEMFPLDHWEQTQADTRWPSSHLHPLSVCPSGYIPASPRDEEASRQPRTTSVTASHQKTEHKLSSTS